MPHEMGSSAPSGMGRVLRVIARVLTLLVATGQVNCSRPSSGGQALPALRLPEKGKTSLVVVTINSLTQDKLGTFGSVPDLTPFLDDMAKTGYSLQWGVTPSADTFGALVGFMTGLSPRFHHPDSLHESWSGPLSDTAVTLAELFKEAGYATLAACPHPQALKTSGLSQGFDAYFDASDFPADRKTFGKDVNQKLLEWLGKKKPPAFFAHLMYIDCEEPYLSKSRTELTRDGKRRSSQPEFADMYNMQVEYVDDQLAELAAEIAATGYSDVAFVVVSDHGRVKNPGPPMNPRVVINSETLLVPWIIGYGPLEPAWTRSYELGSVLDLFPTLAEMFDLTLPAAHHLEGISRVAHMRDEPLLKPRPLSVVWSGDERPAAVFGGNWKLVVEPAAWKPPNPAGQEPGANTGPKHPVLNEFDSRRCRLYRYARDMLDTRNVIAQHDRTARALYEGLGRWLSAAGPEQSRAASQEIEALESDDDPGELRGVPESDMIIEEGEENDE